MRLGDYAVCVVGLGYVGLPLAVAFATKGRRVIGYDISERRVSDLRSGVDTTGELLEQEKFYLESIAFTTTLDHNNLREVHASQHGIVYIVTVPTPIDEASQPDFFALRTACSSIGRVLRRGDVVVFESTVYPGATRGLCVPLLEETSGLSCIFDDSEGPSGDFYVGYSPERINPGDKTHRFRDIRKVVSGSTPFLTAELERLYGSVVAAGIYMAESIEVAEAAKAIENAQRDINIAFVNELALIFSKMNLDTHQVLRAASTKWNFLDFRPGLVGGHCIGVDPYYLAYSAQLVGYFPEVILAGRRINESVADFVTSQVLFGLNRIFGGAKGKRVAIYGVSFKENTPDFRNTQVLKIINGLVRWGVEVIIVDPVVNAAEFARETGYNLISDTEYVKNVDFCVLAVAHREFTKLSGEYLRDRYREGIPKKGLFDVKGFFDQRELGAAGIDVMRL